MSEQEKLEKRRARRQQRILASAESRLNKITGSQSGLRQSPTPSPSNSVSSLPEVPISNTLAEHYPPPHDPRRQKYEERPALSKSQQHRPVVQKMIEEEQARELSESGVLGGKVTQLLLAGMLRRTNPQERMQQKTAGHPANKYWNLLHFVSMAWLGTCAVYYEWLAHGVGGVSSLAKRDRSYYDAIHFSVFWNFVLLQLILLCGRRIYQPEYKPTGESTFMSIASELPEPLKSSAYFVQKYGDLRL
ncbi:hypothetical protein G6F43_003629 [Rhizopus delemar]|nr:hypothetical protein G6F43_003629 [Rhizopus delemar]